MYTWSLRVAVRNFKLEEPLGYWGRSDLFVLFVIGLANFILRTLRVTRKRNYNGDYP